MSINKIKALGYEEPGKDASASKILTFNKPELNPRDLLVRVHAVSVNPIDYKRRAGLFHQPGTQIIFGYDCCGQVEETGSEVKLFKKGDEVYYAGDITRNGTNSDFHIVDERIVALKPKSLLPGFAASFPLVGLTAWEGLFEQLHIPLDKEKNKGKSLLVLGGAGGVGSITIQIAKKLAGLTVIGSASRAETVQFCEKMGADHTVNHTHHLKDEFSKIGIKGVDYVFNTSDLTKKRFDEIIEVLNPLGRLVTIVPLGEHTDISSLKSKCITISFECMFTRPMFKLEMEKQGEILKSLASLIDDGTITEITTQVLAFSQESMLATQIASESGRSIGKTTLDKVQDFFHNH